MRQLLTLCVLLAFAIFAGCNEQAETDGEGKQLTTKREAVTTPGGGGSAEESTGIGEEASRQATHDLLAKLAPDYGIGFDADIGILDGEGFPEGGVPLSKLVDMIEAKLSETAGADSSARDREVRAVLNQLSAVGQASANQGREPEQAPGGDLADTAGDTSTTDAAPPSKNYNPTPNQMMIPDQIYGDWHSVREEHGNTTVEHDKQYYESIQFRYNENKAVFHTFREGKLFSNVEYPYDYDSRSGTITLYGPDRKPLMTMTAQATDPDPYLLWIQRQGSKTKKLYEKMGRAGEPVTLEDEIEGVRILKGDEAAEEYRRQKEKEKAEGNG